jgi:hypothetical protein
MFELGGGMTPTIRTTREFLVFEEPGYARVAMNICVVPAEDCARLITETRVLTDPDSRR